MPNTIKDCLTPLKSDPVAHKGFMSPTKLSPMPTLNKTTIHPPCLQAEGAVAPPKLQGLPINLDYDGACCVHSVQDPVSASILLLNFGIT